MKTAKSIVVLILVALIFFLTGLLLQPEKISFPECSFSAADAIVPIVNDNYFNMTFNEISKANSSIDIILYEFKWYDSTNVVVQMRNALISAVQRNVSVRLFLDQANYRDVETELSKENKKTGNYLKSNGILVKYDSLKQTTHDKMVIIDNETVILGSHNWGYSAFENNNEASVMIKDKEITKYYKNYFESLWKSY